MDAAFGAYMDELFVARLRALRAVDDLVGNLGELALSRTGKRACGWVWVWMGG